MIVELRFERTQQRRHVGDAPPEVNVDRPPRGRIGHRIARVDVPHVRSQLVEGGQRRKAAVDQPGGMQVDAQRSLGERGN